jgi:hypothetical protein
MPHSIYSKKKSFHLLEGTINFFESELKKVKNGRNRSKILKNSKKFEIVLMGYSGVRRKLIYEKNLKLKILCQAPFNGK